MRKNLRLLILLLILLFVALNELANRNWSTSWQRPLVVRIYAVNGDDENSTARYIDGLGQRFFAGIEKFVNREARRYGVTIDALEIEYGGQLESRPPQPPMAGSIAANIWWSLKFRAWAMRRAWSDDATAADIELFVSYHDPTVTPSLRHSVGLQRGLIGIVNAFADQSYAGSNRVVITHELMHTLGAIDKYDGANMPIYPSGYAEPERQPLLPQRRAEIMGGRIPLAAGRAKMPQNLGEVMVGPYTAAEINWLPDNR